MVVPQISTPMKVMTQQVKELPHIKHLDLAQHITADDVEISLLIGADYYWDIIGDHVVKGPGPTAKRKFIEKVDNENVHEGHYLPHRAVHKESLTTPIRIVFDCSYKTQDNPSLNDCLQKEPRLHNAPMNDSSKFPILLP
ncbi:hypothetical protein GQR58_012968 [Nymphon striatum]|nr:hypothetical protein GQR58_012968 [Nymphon striatum]